MFDLTDFDNLQHNWDGQDAIAPDPEVIEYFRNVIDALTWPESDIYADVNGTMEIESINNASYVYHLSVGLLSYTMIFQVKGYEQITMSGIIAEEPFPVEAAQVALDLCQQVSLEAELSKYKPGTLK